MVAPVHGVRALTSRQPQPEGSRSKPAGQFTQPTGTQPASPRAGMEPGGQPSPAWIGAQPKPEGSGTKPAAQLLQPTGAQPPPTSGRCPAGQRSSPPEPPGPTPPS